MTAAHRGLAVVAALVVSVVIPLEAGGASAEAPPPGAADAPLGIDPSGSGDVVFDEAALALAPAPQADQTPVSALAAPASLVQAAAGPIVIDRGHVDLLDIAVEGTGLSILAKDGSGAGVAVHRSPSHIALRVADSSIIAVAPGPVEFLGAVGSTVYVLPQSEDPNLVWPGWNTERIRSGELVDDSLTLRMTGVAGPGVLTVYTINQFGIPSVVFGNRSDTTNRLNLKARAHAHANWAFSAAGVYRVSFEASATIRGGGPVRGQATYTFVVGNNTPVPGPGESQPSASVPGGVTTVPPTGNQQSTNATPGNSSRSNTQGSPTSEIAAGGGGAQRSGSSVQGGSGERRDADVDSVPGLSNAGITSPDISALARTGDDVAPRVLAGLGLVMIGAALSAASVAVRRRSLVGLGR